jgi:hypothetical protein
MVWWAFPIAEVVSFLTCCFFMRKIVREKLNFEDGSIAPELPAEEA